jgi:Saxitoxin biosynthesis operon protein SxtJ
MKADQQSDRVFGFTFAGLFFLITTVGWIFFDRLPYWALVAAIVFTLLASAVPSVLMPLNRLWQRIGPKVASINNVIILGVVFYLFITPIGLIMRLFGRDPMHRSTKEKVATYWTAVQRQADSESFSDQF